MSRAGSARRPARILYAEDEERWVETVRDIFQRAGARADAALTPEEALERVSNSFYHVMILDLSFDAGNAFDHEGLSLLDLLDKLGLLGAMDIVMLSAYADKMVVREAFGRYRVADFMDKYEFEDSELIKTVTELIAERVNLGLEVLWEGAGGPEQHVLGLRVNGENVQRDSPLCARLKEELDDLLCRLFRDALWVQVSPLVGEPDGGGALWARPYYPGGSGQVQVVRFGEAGMIDAEYRNYREHVLPFIGGGSFTSVSELRRTPLLGGLVYSLLGSSDERLETFSSFYARADVEQIKELLDRLVLETCGGWYANLGKRKLMDLANAYRQSLGLQPDVLQGLARTFKSGDGRLNFAQLAEARSFTNPFTAAAKMSFRTGTYECITHGRLKGDNVLVEDRRQPWLINFGSTGTGHVLRDIACLDSFIRFRLLTEQDATLGERLELEESLYAAGSGGPEPSQSPLASENPAVCKAHAVALHLRGLARTHLQAAEDAGEYYVPLFFYALDSVRRSARPSVWAQHALLSASLIADRLSL